MLPAPANAAFGCGKRSDFITALAKRYDESPIGRGVAGEVNVVELTISPAGSWTIIATYTDGQTCILAAGKDWKFSMPKPKENKT